MLITAIEPRRQSLCEIYLDGQSAGMLDLETVERLRIRIGQELSDADWQEYCEESDRTRAKSYALWLLSRRAMTRRGLLDKLRTRYSAQASQAAVERAEELGLIDDEDYARRYASDLYRFKNFSSFRVAMQLRQKGIDRELALTVAEEVGAQMAPQSEDTIRNLLEGKYNRYLSDEKGRRRVVAALQRLGYRWDEIRPVLQEFTQNNQEEPD